VCSLFAEDGQFENEIVFHSAAISQAPLQFTSCMITAKRDCRKERFTVRKCSCVENMRRLILSTT
jgi:hypothetical protein